MKLLKEVSLNKEIVILVVNFGDIKIRFFDISDGNQFRGAKQHGQRLNLLTQILHFFNPDFEESKRF